jgi:AAA15 family ATPase/GTPase
MQFLKEYLNKSVGCFPLKTPSNPNQGKLMSKHFIKDIEIKNFKCFEDFRAEGFGRVNLIGGKNNVGKTAFMESLYIFVNGFTISNFLFTLANINSMRYKTDSIVDLINRKSFNPLDNLTKFDNLNISTNETSVKFKSINRDGQLLFDIVAYNEKVQEINKNLIDLGLNRKHISHFINVEVVESRLLKTFYAVVQLLRKEEYLNMKLNEFDNTIESFKFIGDEPMIFKKNITEPIHLNEYGFGSKQLIHYIIALFAMQDKVLFIDEIASGIHYTNYDRLWEIILTLSKQQNIQVFATTHSDECIKSYAKVSKRLEEKDITFIDLGKNRKNEIKAIVMNSERFQREIEMDNEVRGW